MAKRFCFLVFTGWKYQVISPYKMLLLAESSVNSNWKKHFKKMQRSHFPSLAHRPLSAGGPQTFHSTLMGIGRHIATWTSIWPWIVFPGWRLLVDPRAFLPDGSLIQRILTRALSLLFRSVRAISILSAHADRNCRIHREKKKKKRRIWRSRLYVWTFHFLPVQAWVFSGSSLLPQTKHMHIRWIRDFD